MNHLTSWLLLQGERFLEFIRVRPPAYRILPVEDVPDSVKGFHLYVVAEESPWLAVMACPCGCGALIHLSLLDADSPHWQLQWDRTKKPTLSPSVWRTQGCKAHFFLKKGYVQWV